MAQKERRSGLFLLIVCSSWTPNSFLEYNKFATVNTILFLHGRYFWQTKSMIRRFGAIFSALGFFLAGCSSSPDVDGVYVYHGNGIAETLKLKSDGTFVQVIEDSGRTYNAQGQWRLEHSRTIKLRRFLSRFSP